MYWSKMGDLCLIICLWFWSACPKTISSDMPHDYINIWSLILLNSWYAQHNYRILISNQHHKYTRFDIYFHNQNLIHTYINTNNIYSAMEVRNKSNHTEFKFWLLIELKSSVFNIKWKILLIVTENQSVLAKCWNVKFIS